MAARKRKILRVLQQKEQEQLRLEHAAQVKRLEAQLIGERMLEQEEFERILLEKDPDELLALATNPDVSIQSIQKLVTCHQVKDARQIREAAEQNVQARK